MTPRTARRPPTGPAALAGTPRADVASLLDELRHRLAALPEQFAAGRPAPAPDRAPRFAFLGSDAPGGDPLHRAIRLGQTAGAVVGAGIFYLLSARL